MLPLICMRCVPCITNTASNQRLKSSKQQSPEKQTEESCVGCTKHARCRMFSSRQSSESLMLFYILSLRQLKG